MCCWTSEMADKRNAPVYHHNGIFMIREKKVEWIYPDHTSINRFVVSEAILKCLHLIEACYGNNSILNGYNTDGVYITNPKMNSNHKKTINLTDLRSVKHMLQIMNRSISRRITEKTWFTKITRLNIARDAFLTAIHEVVKRRNSVKCERDRKPTCSFFH